MGVHRYVFGREALNEISGVRTAIDEKRHGGNHASLFNRQMKRGRSPTRSGNPLPSAPIHYKVPQDRGLARSPLSNTMTAGPATALICVNAFTRQRAKEQRLMLRRTATTTCTILGL